MYGHGNPLCAYAINVGAGANRLLGCQSLPTSGASPFNPVGNLEVASQTPGILNLRGWAADPDGDPTTQLRVYIDGHPMLQTTAALSRPDVARFGLSATSGFNLTLPVFGQGHFTCVYAQNTGRAGLQNTTVGCAHTLEPAPPAPGPHDPRGNFESSPLGGTEQNLQFGGTGWGFDPDSSAPATVRFMGLGSFEGGPALTLTTHDVQTGIARPDVQTQFPAAGPNSGFSGTNVTGAQHPAWLCAYVLNVGPGTNRFLGCATWFYVSRSDTPPMAVGWDVGTPGPFPPGGPTGDGPFV